MFEFLIWIIVGVNFSSLKFEDMIKSDVPLHDTYCLHEVKGLLLYRRSKMFFSSLIVNVKK